MSTPTDKTIINDDMVDALQYALIGNLNSKPVPIIGFSVYEKALEKLKIENKEPRSQFDDWIKQGKILIDKAISQADKKISRL